MAVIDRKFDRKILIMRSRSRSRFFSIHRDRCRDLWKVTAVLIARSNNRDRHNPEHMLWTHLVVILPFGIQYSFRTSWWNYSALKWARSRCSWNRRSSMMRSRLGRMMGWRVSNGSDALSILPPTRKTPFQSRYWESLIRSDDLSIARPVRKSSTSVRFFGCFGR